MASIPKPTPIRNYRVWRKTVAEAWVFVYRGHEFVAHFPVVRFKDRPMRGWQISKDGIPLTQIDKPQLSAALAEFVRLGEHWDTEKFGSELSKTLKSNAR